MRSPVSSSVRGSILSGLADAVAEAGTRTTLPVLVTSPELRARGAAIAAGQVPQLPPVRR